MNHLIQSMPVLILYPHRRCNCRCIMCDIWKDTAKDEISCRDLERYLEDIERLSVRWIVLSGGEPLMHSNAARFCSLIRERQIRLTVLTTGLLLERNASTVVESVDDVIISLDGPAAVHDEIRRIPDAYQRLASGIRSVHALRPDFPVAARSTIQRVNYNLLRETTHAAKNLGCRSISFLAADLTSEAFNRADAWNPDRQDRVALSESQIIELEAEAAALLNEWNGSGFVAEGEEKFARIIKHFRAHLGLDTPTAPRCNAPWVSTVIESDGTVRPCFFHRPIGKLGDAGLLQILNGFEALAFRSSLDVENNPTCQRCVCSLNWRGAN